MVFCLMYNIFLDHHLTIFIFVSYGCRLTKEARNLRKVFSKFISAMVSSHQREWVCFEGSLDRWDFVNITTGEAVIGQSEQERVIQSQNLSQLSTNQAPLKFWPRGLLQRFLAQIQQRYRSNRKKIGDLFFTHPSFNLFSHLFFFHGHSLILAFPCLLFGGDDCYMKYRIVINVFT